MSEIVTAGILVIGDEILSGRTQDKNIAQVADWLNRQGIRLAEVRVVVMRTTSLCVGGAAPLPPVKLKIRPLRSSTPSRASAGWAGTAR